MRRRARRPDRAPAQAPARPRRAYRQAAVGRARGDARALRHRRPRRRPRAPDDPRAARRGGAARTYAGRGDRRRPRARARRPLLLGRGRRVGAGPDARLLGRADQVPRPQRVQRASAKRVAAGVLPHERRSRVARRAHDHRRPGAPRRPRGAVRDRRRRPRRRGLSVPGTLGVIATAGHVDHGKSALIVALTGIDPDRFEEEKRRGLTIDLGYAWTTLPSGREVGFVDVPGHERFIRNMLAGVGPVRLVLFVVAADEGWKPQSEEHLQILDVLGVAGGVIALTKTDLVDADGIELATDDVREHVAGTALADAPILPVSAKTGDGLPELIAALDRMVVDAPAPEEARTRLFVDRVFTITGAGTVVTGTLTGGCLETDEVVLEPGGVRARVRSLQTHKRARDQACHVARVAVNLVG